MARGIPSPERRRPGAFLSRGAAVLGLLGLLCGEAMAWPANLMESLNRDARKLLPKSLARLLARREPQILDEVARFPPQLGQALAEDLSAGRLQPDTLAALDAETAGIVEMLKQQRVGEGLVRLGALLRVPADLSDPVLTAGPEGYPSGVTREYYAFIEASLDKIPVVLSDPPALELSRKQLPDYWQGLLGRSRGQSPVIRIELFQGGRVVDHKSIDYRSPVFGVASLSYSRAVTAIAATWLAVWREARGDLTRRREPRVIVPRTSETASAPEESRP
jgi:ribosome modulation factor